MGIYKVCYLFTIPGLIDLIRFATGAKEQIDLVLVMIASIAALFGSITQMARLKKEGGIRNAEIVFIITLCPFSAVAGYGLGIIPDIPVVSQYPYFFAGLLALFLGFGSLNIFPAAQDNFIKIIKLIPWLFQIIVKAKFNVKDDNENNNHL